MATLDNDVYALTSLVQSCIRDYIYAETLNFDQIKAQLDENNRTIFCFTILASLLVVILTVGLSVRAAQKYYRSDTQSLHVNLQSSRR